MTFADLVLLALVLSVSAWVAWRARPAARVLLFVSALAVSAALFLPTPMLVALAGRELVSSMEAVARRSPWQLPDAVHFMAFLWMGFVLWWFRPDLRGWRCVGVLSVLAVAAELTQVLTPGRTPRLGDVAVNLLAAAAGLLLAVLIRGLTATLASLWSHRRAR